MFIAGNCIYTLAPEERPLARADAAPPELEEHNAARCYKHYAPPERETLCQVYFADQLTFQRRVHH
jgi:hypothetical protein